VAGRLIFLIVRGGADRTMSWFLSRPGRWCLAAAVDPLCAELDDNSVNRKVPYWLGCDMHACRRQFYVGFWGASRFDLLGVSAGYRFSISMCRIQLKLMMLPFTCVQLRIRLSGAVAGFADGRFCGYRWFRGKHNWDEGWRTQPLRRFLVRVEVLRPGRLWQPFDVPALLGLRRRGWWPWCVNAVAWSNACFFGATLSVSDFGLDGKYAFWTRD